MVGMVIMRYLINFSYSGAHFNGYQKQPGLRCVQTEIEKVLTDINNKKSVIIYSAGRTDGTYRYNIQEHGARSSRTAAALHGTEDGCNRQSAGSAARFPRT